MDALRELLSTNPDTEVISLEFSQISDLSELIEDLKGFTFLKELSLHGNRLTRLPSDLSFLSGLEIIDLSNNLFDDIESVLDGLKSIPNLKVLSINLASKDEGLLLHHLTNLQILNDRDVRTEIEEIEGQNIKQGYASFDPKEVQKNVNKKLSNDQINPEKNEEANSIGIRQEDLEAVGNLFDSIREIYKEKEPDRDIALAEEFEDHVKNVMNDLTKKLYESMNSKPLAAINISKAKYALYEICFEKLIDYISAKDERLQPILESIHDAHIILFNEIAASKEAKAQQQIPQPPVDLNGDTAKLLEAAESLERDVEKLKEDKENLILTFEQERKELYEQLNSLQEENSKYLNKIIRLTKENADNNLTKSQEQSFTKNAELRNRSKSPNTQNYDSFALNQSNRQNQSHTHSYLANPSNQIARGLTLKQLRDVIEDIYNSKTKYDQRCLDSRLPRETMEQHMYTYLNQKYGLKNLIIEWASAIINGIKKYSSEDNDIAVFGKILRNECDEEFRYVQTQVKTTIAELLKMYIRAKLPLKTNSEIKELLQVKMASSISEDECNDIINYMYTPEDAEFLMNKIKRHFRYPKRATPDPRKKLSREEFFKLQQEKEKEKPIVDYFQFQKVILDFQLRSHEKFLKNFIVCFRKIDRDLNGIVNENEFQELCGMFEEQNIVTDTDRLLMTVDPYNHQQITFSQCVTLFSSEMIPDENGEQYSVLQKLSNE